MGQVVGRGAESIWGSAAVTRSTDPLTDALTVLEHMVIGPCDGKYDPATLSDAAQRRMVAMDYIRQAIEQRDTQRERHG